MENEAKIMVDTSEAKVEEIKPVDEKMKKLEAQLFFTKLIALFTGVTCVTFVAISCIVIPPIMQTLNSAQVVMDTANTTMVAATTAIEAAEKSLASVETMTDSIIGTSEQLSSFVTDNASTMTDTMTELSNVDFEGLNQAITDLQDAVGPFANLMRKFQ